MIVPRRRPHVAIVGAGPVGLDCALAAAEAGLPFTLYEGSGGVGGHVSAWSHVRLFTPWEMNISPRMARALEAAGRPLPGGPDCPSGAELVRDLLDPLAELPAIAPHLELDARVTAIGREGLLKHEEISTPGRAARSFRLLIAGPDGAERVAGADVVLDCSGSWGNPNCTGDGGIPAPGERALGDAIVRTIPDLARAGADWAGWRTLLVGAGHSAQTAADALASLAREAPETRVYWAMRREEAPVVAGRQDPLPERGRLESAALELTRGASPSVECRRGFIVEELRRVSGSSGGRPTERRGEGAEVAAREPGGREWSGKEDGPREEGSRIAAFLRGPSGTVERIEVDRVLSLTGSVGDHALYRQLQVHECYATSGPMKLSAALLGESSADCLDQSGHGVDTLKNPEPNFFILGEKSYGRNNTFLMRIGWQQVDDVFGLLA